MKLNPTLKRIKFSVDHDSIDRSKWITGETAIEKLFIDSNPHVSSLKETEAAYYMANNDLVSILNEAGNTLHEMFLKATEKVLNDDKLLIKFGIPTSLWDKIKSSFAHQKHTLSGRFDFAFHDNQLKIYEYNADSSSTLLETGYISQKWLESLNVSRMGRNSGAQLSNDITQAFRRMGISETIHFFIDDDDEEEYTALFVKQCADAAGIPTKLIRPNFKAEGSSKTNLVDFEWRDGVICDLEGVPVKHLWKTWSWETIFTDYKSVVGDDAASSDSTTATSTLASKVNKRENKNKNGSHPRISEVFLSDHVVTVLEPLWKTITGNKALLPIIWDMFPHHANLLRTEWELTDDLRTTGFAMKPIVGRQGQNVTLVKPHGHLLAESVGKFGERDMIYQELFSLPEFEGHHCLLGGWIIGGRYSSTGIREDTAIITSLDSPCPPMLIAREDEPADDNSDCEINGGKCWCKAVVPGTAGSSGKPVATRACIKLEYDTTYYPTSSSNPLSSSSSPLAPSSPTGPAFHF